MALNCKVWIKTLASLLVFTGLAWACWPPLGYIPPRPDYTSPDCWFTQLQDPDSTGGDIFYVISTETGDRQVGGDTCHFADTYDQVSRGAMFVEMAAVDSFYSGRLNFYSPFYRQVSMQRDQSHRWSTTHDPCRP